MSQSQNINHYITETPFILKYQIIFVFLHYAIKMPDIP